MKGKYNFANIFIDEVEETAKQQIQTFLNHPAFANTYIAIMPDTHAGMGAVIGFTMKLNDYVIPNVVGVDIGCGIDTYNLGKIDIDYAEFDRFIKANIPCGFNRHKHQKIFMSEKETELEKIVEKTGQDLNSVSKSLGTLGGGNHFIEIDEDPVGNKWLTIHSGSRNFGHKIASYHQTKAKELLNKMFIEDSYKQLEFLPLEHGGQDYLNDMAIAQLYAETNRWGIAYLILTEYFKIPLEEIIKLKTVKSIHNYIDLENKIIRKGAISAQEGERCIIPFNMKDGLVICKGKGNKAYNYSAPHGAGRVMSRTKAKAEIKLEDFQKTMKGVWTSTVNSKTLDEAPMAYKDITDTVDIEFFMKPVYNFKDDTSGRRRRK
jgi:RNA-splicing ligase RtcB